MSGGAYDYAFERVLLMAEALESNKRLDGFALYQPNGHDRIGFAAHLRKVAAAMKAIEWVDSGDSSPPEDTLAIHAVTGMSPDEVHEYASDQVDQALRELDERAA